MGLWSSGDVPAPIIRRNPARPTESVGRVPPTALAGADHALERAAAAAPGWAATPVQERLVPIRHAVAAIEDAAGDLAGLLVAELGITAAEAAAELGAGRWCLRALEDAVTEALAPEHVGDTTVAHEPPGVTACLTTWSAPITLPLAAALPALVAGAAVVVKPSEVVPLCAAQVLETLATYLPEGVLPVLQGGRELGRHVAGDDRVVACAVLGSVDVVRSVRSGLVRRGARTVGGAVGAEAVVLLDDADLAPGGLEDLVARSLRMNGQAPSAPRRVLVPRARVRDLAEAWETAAAAAVLGDPSDPEVTVGPVATEELAVALRRALRTTADAGGRLVPLGRATCSEDDGWYVPPHLVLVDGPATVPDEASSRGPVVVAVPYDDDRDVPALAAAVTSAATATVVSADVERARAVARGLRVARVRVHGVDRATPQEPASAPAVAALDLLGADGLRTWSARRTIVGGAHRGG